MTALPCRPNAGLAADPAGLLPAAAPAKADLLRADLAAMPVVLADPVQVPGALVVDQAEPVGEDLLRQNR
jgi:hypothetical protein